MTTFPTMRSWLAAEKLPPAQAEAEKLMLRRTGFLKGAREDLTNGGTAALSIVEQFRTPQAARAALAFYVSLVRTGDSGTFKPFAVHSIPQAHGLGDINNSGVNIAFSDGPYYYLVGEMGGGPATTAELNAAAVHLYRRVRQ